MGRGEVDVGVVGVGNSASFAVGVVGGCEVGKVTGNPGVDAHNYDEKGENEVGYEPASIGAIALLDWVNGGVPGTMGSLWETRFY